MKMIWGFGKEASTVLITYPRMEKLLISIIQQMLSPSHGPGPQVSIEENQTKPEAAQAFTKTKR